MKKRIPVDQAIGMVLPHDITEIVQGEFKGCAFKKGHILRLEDVEHLRRLGKEHIYALELSKGEIHETRRPACWLLLLPERAWSIPIRCPKARLR
ncbi:hypothetical protein H206_02960 [Candidatus Electrothrix aarhusensis]|uniref:Uncharacterized protein n=1 Tax=Candidatus Electrothrix aarhusensis TaxID=1859131 RepID=A0A444ISP8_9BACT|nr:hypothetical protein H206_02960 [Candidatus Electrothrix aarhusensis]